jgi:hypothetical protein
VQWPAEQRDAEAALYKQAADQFAVRSCGAVARLALYWVLKLPVVAAGQWQAESAQLESLARLALLAAKSQAELPPVMVAEQQHAAALPQLRVACSLQVVPVPQAVREAAEPGLAAGAAARLDGEPGLAVLPREQAELVRSAVLGGAERVSSRPLATQELDAAESQRERPAAWR